MTHRAHIKALVAVLSTEHPTLLFEVMSTPLALEVTVNLRPQNGLTSADTCLILLQYICVKYHLSLITQCFRIFFKLVLFNPSGI